MLNVGGFPGVVIEEIILKNCTFRGVEKPDRICDARQPKMENVIIGPASAPKDSAENTRAPKAR